MKTILRFFFLIIATTLGGLLITLTTPLKFFETTEKFCYRSSIIIARVWGNLMRWLLMKTISTDIQISGDQPDPNATYLLIANHQSWIDILMIMVALGPGTTLPRFFMKWQLIYVPVIGSCAFALDFPIMRRYTQEDIKKKPELKHRDFNYAQRVLSRHPDQPCIVVNFAEGTRFTKEKHVRNKSPYRHLLKPKVAGPQLTLNSLHDRLDGIVDITLCYRNSRLGLWSLLSGTIPLISIHREVLEIPARLKKTPEKLSDFKDFRGFMNERWALKDALLDQMLNDRQVGDHTSR